MSDMYPFGDVLRGFRWRAGMSRKELAEKLGVHLNTVGAWERGEYLPNSRTTVIELVRILSLNDEDQKQFLKACLLTSIIEASPIIETKQQQIKPGGIWICPVEGEVIDDSIKFAIFAYPTSPKDPPIKYVNFTVGWHGYWQVANTVYPSDTIPMFSCEVKLSQLHIPSGQIQVSFDVYDQVDNRNLAPNGVYTLEYRISI